MPAATMVAAAVPTAAATTTTTVPTTTTTAATTMGKGHSMSSGQEESKTHRDAKSHCPDTHDLTSRPMILGCMSNKTERGVHSSGRERRCTIRRAQICRADRSK
jgi:hypothetical protein